MPRSPAASFLMIRDVRKCTRTCRIPACAVALFLPFSNLADVIYSFCFARRRTDTRMHVPALTGTRGSGTVRIDPGPGITSNVTSSAFTCASYPVWHNLSLPLRLSLVLCSSRSAYNMGRLAIERRRRREVSAAADISRAELGEESTDGTWNTPARQRLVV